MKIMVYAFPKPRHRKGRGKEVIKLAEARPCPCFRCSGEKKYTLVFKGLDKQRTFQIVFKLWILHMDRPNSQAPPGHREHIPSGFLSLQELDLIFGS